MPSTDRDEILILSFAVGSALIGTGLVVIESEIIGLFMCGVALILVVILGGSNDGDQS